MRADQVYPGQKVRVAGDPRNWEVEPNLDPPYGTKQMVRVWTALGFEEDGFHQWGYVMYVLPSMLTDAECTCWKCGTYAAEGEEMCAQCVRDQCETEPPPRSFGDWLFGRGRN